MNFELKLTALSTVHIGTGEDFEPINYVIDKNEKNEDRLYEFDEFEFYKSLPQEKQKEFDAIVSNNSALARFKLYSFIVQNKAIAKKIAFNSVVVLKEIAQEYYAKIGKTVQNESGGKSVFNKFEIAKCYTNPNTHLAVILGSSIKGSISTAYQEFLLQQGKSYAEVEQLMLKPTKENLFKNLLIADANTTKQNTFICNATNKRRNRETTTQSLKPILQAVAVDSEFTTTITCKAGLDFKLIVQSCNKHYLPLFKSQFNIQTDSYLKEALNKEFIQKYEKWQPMANQFLLKIGKYSGARAVTVDGIRNIKIMTGKGRPPRYSTEETTAWLRGGNNSGLLPFGWMLCEIV